MGHAEVLVRAAERFGELRADVVSVPVVAKAQLRQPLRADHVPYPVQPAGDHRRVDHRLDRAGLAGRGAGADRLSPRPHRVLGTGHGAAPVAVVHSVLQARICEWRAGHRRDVAAAMPDDSRQAVG